jgi:hydroxymethylglutaryl-CoA reductase (NADPH)
MPTDYRRITEFLKRAVPDRDRGDIARLLPRHDAAPPRVPGGASVGDAALDERWTLPGMPAATRTHLADAHTLEQREAYARNIENFIGTVKVPVGLAGPLRVNGLFANGDFYIPLATTEAALVASYSRGARLLTEAGGCTALLVNEGVSRAPGFGFDTVVDAALFVVWATSQIETFTKVAAGTTRHGELVDMQVALEGNHVYLVFEFTTGEASGQNMVTIATDAICRHIAAHAPVHARRSVVEANLSGDKKATTQSFMRVRGKKVSAEVRLPADLVSKRLHTTPATLVDYWRMSAIGGVMSGSIGIHGHYANGLAALFIACGQDAACVAEATVGVTRFEMTDDGSLYAAVTLPSLIVGTVGGGTALPSQRACLDILGARGPDSARALAEIAAAVALAGELSITGALTAGEFTSAHERLARGPAGGSQPREEAGPTHGT